MKRKIFTIIFLLLGLIMLVACGDTASLTFDGEPTVETGQVAGQLVLSAKSKQDGGIVFYAVFPSSVTAKTGSQVVTAEDSLASGSSTTQELQTTVTLEADTEYSVFFVVREGEKFSEVKRVVQRTDELEDVTLGFAGLGLSGGIDDGTLNLNAITNGIGTIYYVLVPEGSTIPTAEQIVAGVDYGDVVVNDAGNAASFTNHIISGLTPLTRYTAHLVVAHEGEFSTTRAMTAQATLYVPPVDKGEGTEEDPFRVSTIEDLEQIGQGFYEVDGKEWNVFNHYILENDIDLTEKYGEGLESWESLGADSAGARFEGVFDGQGHSIIGLYMDATSSIAPYRGLFASSEPSAVVRNLVFVDPYIHASGIGESDSNHGAGVVFGYLKGTVDNVEIINGVVEDTLGGTRIGGIAGRAYVTGSITNTYVNAKVSGFNRIGGLLGVADTSDQGTETILIKNVVFNGEVIGADQHIGGLVGYARAVEVSNVFVTGYIQGARDTGGVLGFYQKRGGNNNVAASITDVVVHATIYGTGQNTTIGAVIGNRSTSGLIDFEHLLIIGDLWQVEGTTVSNGGNDNSFDGVEITREDVGSLEWFEDNIPNWDFDVFELGASHERPVLAETSDNGLLLELEMPLVTLSTITPGVEERELRVELSSNQANSTIYYIVVAQSGEYSAEDIMDPTSVLFSGSGEIINATHLMDEFDTEYFVYYVVELEDETVSAVFSTSGKSRQMTELTITGGLRPGPNNKEIIINLSTNLPATIYYIIVAEQGEFTIEQIKEGTLGLFSGTGTTIDNVVHVMPEENETYFFYAYAEAASEDRDALENGEGLSSSAEVVHYGTGTAADPFIIRTIDDFEAIGRGLYNVNDVPLTYAPSAHYVLAADIDLSSEYGEGKLSWVPIPEFSGTLNGSGHTVSGLYIRNENTGGLVGLFSRVNGGTIRNLVLDNIDIYSGFEAPADGNSNAVAALTARMNSSVIEDITITNASIITNTFRVGMLIGSLDNGNDAAVRNVYAQGVVVGAGRVGGLIGNLTNDATTPLPVENIVVLVEVTATRANSGNGRVGGVIGWARGVGLRNVYVEALVVGTTGTSNLQTGGVVGYIEAQTASNLNAALSNILANVVVVGHSSATNLIYGGGGSDRHPSIENVFHTTLSALISPNSPAGSSEAGVLAPDELTEAWFTTNLPSLSAENGWIFEEGQDRPSLENQPDAGLINELDMPLLTFVVVSPGVDEKELKIELSSNQANSTIHYIVVSEEGEYTAEDIMNPDDVLFYGSGEEISATHLMAAFDTEYFVYYVVELADETVSEVFVESGKSKEMTNLVISGGLRPGEENKELIINLDTNLEATIYYIVVESPSEYTIDDIKNPSEVLFSGNGSIIDNEVLVMPLEDEEYYFYAIAEATDRSSVIVSGSGRSKSAEVINYGSGTEADPFIIRSVNDLAAIGSGLYDGNGEELDYGNNSHYVLANDIDLSLSYGSDKLSWTPIADFRGVIDGAGFTISGLYIAGSGEGRFGFVQYLNNGIIRNLTLDSAVVLIEDDEGSPLDHNNHGVGALVGHVGNSSVIENVRVLNVSVTANRERVGGLIGSSTDHASNANNIFNNIFVEGDVIATGRVGGVFGNLGGTQSATHMVVSNVVFIGTVTATVNNRVGGVIGWTQNTSISNVYVEAVVDGQGTGNQAGGAIGYIQDGATPMVITNVLAHVSVNHAGANNVGTIVGAKQSAADPTVTVVYQTIESSLTFVGGSPSGNAYQGLDLPAELDAEWFITNMPGFSTENGWEFKEGASRPTLVGTFDVGLFGDLGE